MTIAPDEPDIAELDFDPSDPQPITGPDRIDEQTMAWAREQGGTYTYGDTHPEDWDSTSLDAMVGVVEAIQNIVANAQPFFDAYFQAYTGHVPHINYGCPYREPGSIGLAGAHAVPLVGLTGGIAEPQLTATDLYDAVREIQNEERVMPSPTRMDFMTWLAHCTPHRGELLAALEEVPTMTCHTWTSDEAT